MVEREMKAAIVTSIETLLLCVKILMSFPKRSCAHGIQITSVLSFLSDTRSRCLRGPDFHWLGVGHSAYTATCSRMADGRRR